MSFFDQIFGSRKKSASAAKERLQLVLVHDRADLSPARLESLKDEMIDLISRYVDIDRGSVEIALTQDRHEQRLVADIPLNIDRRRRD
ncbi:MAG: cell division topological specificity factor MinE [Anaerolineales bacterium]